MEAVMASAGRTMSFVDLGRTTASVPTWARYRIPARDWGVQPVTVVPAESYDGLLYIDTVTPPEYLK